MNQQSPTRVPGQIGKSSLASSPVCRHLMAAGLLAALSAGPLLAGPNLMAVGNYDEMPFRRAEGRDSFNGREVVFSFDDPDFDFGRVVVRSNSPTSIVRRDVFVGFAGNGLRVSTSSSPGSGSLSLTDVEIWLRVHGKIRGGASYEWEMETPNELSSQGVPAYIPAVWADGQIIGAQVNITFPELDEADSIRRLIIPHGVVKMPQFDAQTGAAWVVLRPRPTGNEGFTVARFSLREIDLDRSASLSSTMPSPVRYVSIRNALEDQIASILQRGADALLASRTPEGFWNGGTPEANVALTSRILAAVAELRPGNDDIQSSLTWLAAQEPADNQVWGVETAARQLYCLARHVKYEDHRATIQRLVEFLIHAQADNGGWGAVSADPELRASTDRNRLASSRVDTTHEHSFLVLLALREAALSGAIVDRQPWRGVMQYWGEARAYDGGFTRRVGGLDQATTAADTAMGAAAILAAVDASSAIGSRRCTGYFGSALQLKLVTGALEWLDEFYGARFRNFGSLTQAPDPYLEAGRMQFLGAISGVRTFNGKDHFVESAQELVRHFDPDTSMFGVRGPDNTFAEPASAARTTEALTVLGVGAAPPVCQRIVVGEDKRNLAQYSGDAQHLVRYLARQRGRQFNWRRVTVDDTLDALVETPILFVNVMGPFEWTDEQWNKIRNYALAGGSVVFDVISEEETQQEAVLEGLRRAFPEYEPAPLPADHSLFVTPNRIAEPMTVHAIGNGFREFVFVPTTSWSCHFHTYDLKSHTGSFEFVDNLLHYCRDGGEPPSAFADSTYPPSGFASKTMAAQHLEVGGKVRAYPNLRATLDRLMRSNFRTAVDAAESADKADLMWVSVTGDAAWSDEVTQGIKQALEAGTFLVSDVVSGNDGWDEAFRARLTALGDDIAIETLSRNDPVFTGEIKGTQGFDAVNVELRKALHTRFSTRGRCALYRIRYKGKTAGIHSAYDLSSGIEYHLFPGCRGVMPEAAREIAMNALLIAYGRKLAGGPGA